MIRRAHIKEICWRTDSQEKIVVACTALSLDDEQYSYSDRDGEIEHLRVQMFMRNKGSLFLCLSMR